MFPAQALAEVMLARGWQVTLSTDARGMRYAAGFPAEVRREVVLSATPARGGLAGRIAVPFRVGAGVLAALGRMGVGRPSVVAGFGGYPTIPALSAALALRVPALIHEQNGVLGRVNRVFAPRVAAVACGTWPTVMPAGVQTIHVGNPVRGAILARAGTPYPSPAAGPIRILVIGGSQGARALSDLVPPALAALPEDLRSRLHVSQQARAEDLGRVVAAYEAEGIAAEIRPFFDDVAERMARASLVIARAGASTIADLTVIGRPAVLIPYPHAAADHQTANARALEAAGGAVVLPEAELTAGALTAVLRDLLAAPDRVARMAAAALAAGRPDAAERLAALVEGLARREKQGRT